MKLWKSALLALSLMAAPSLAVAQDAPAPAPAPTIEPAPAPEPGRDVAVVPDSVAPAPATQAVPTVEGLKPMAGVGQPVEGGLDFQPQVTPTGRQAYWMHNYILLPLITAISLVVLALLLWVIVRYRRAANEVPSKTSHNTLIEVIWTLVPVLILVAIAVPSISLLAAQFKPAGEDALTVKATGNQWYWTYTYPDNGGFEIVSNMLKEKGEVEAGQRFRTDADGPRLLAVDNRMVIPVGRTIRLQTTSNDVIHAFGVNSLWTKIDAVPGRLNETSFKAEREGVYFGQCYELCGARHAYMPIVVEVVSPERFAAWVASKGGTMTPQRPTGAAADAGDDTTTPAGETPLTETGPTVNATAVPPTSAQGATSSDYAQ